MTEQRTTLRRQADRSLRDLIDATIPVLWRATIDATGHTFEFRSIRGHTPEPGITIERVRR